MAKVMRDERTARTLRRSVEPDSDVPLPKTGGFANGSEQRAMFRIQVVLLGVVLLEDREEPIWVISRVGLAEILLNKRSLGSLYKCLVHIEHATESSAVRRSDRHT